jgi:hypothetical protein
LFTSKWHLGATLLLWPVLSLAGSWCEKPVGAAGDQFAPYGDSYFLANQMDNRGWAGHDERALRARYSFKYTVCGTRYVPKATRTSNDAPQDMDSTSLELFLSYGGEFDFYLGTRPSGPVINRLSNPAINLRMPLRRLFPERADKDDNFTISLEHRSDGQTTDASTALGTERTQAAYDRQDRAYFDTISRGANFIGLTIEATDVLKTGRSLDVGAKLRLYLNHESTVAWGPFAGKPRTIKDYDLLQTYLSYETGWGWFDASWRVGAAGLPASSLTLGYQAPFSGLPVYVQWHRGPMNTLSNYTQRQDSFGIGLRFARPFRGG